MKNKHEIQKDFYTRMEEWKRKFKAESSNRKELAYPIEEIKEKQRQLNINATKIDSPNSLEYERQVEEFVKRNIKKSRGISVDNDDDILYR